MKEIPFVQIGPGSLQNAEENLSGIVVVEKFGIREIIELRAGGSKCGFEQTEAFCLPFFKDFR